MPDIVSALYTLRPTSQWLLDGESYSGLKWFDKEQPKPTKEEIADEIVRQEQQVPFDQCKKKAKELISATDWSVLPDVGLKNKSDFQTYRATLRGLIANPVANPEWPTEPQPIWSN